MCDQARTITINLDSFNKRPIDTSKTDCKPKLLDRIREALRSLHYSHRTEKTYCHWVKRFIFFHISRKSIRFMRKTCPKAGDAFKCPERSTANIPMRQRNGAGNGSSRRKNGGRAQSPVKKDGIIPTNDSSSGCQGSSTQGGCCQAHLPSLLCHAFA